MKFESNGLVVLLALVCSSAVFACNGSITTEGEVGRPGASADASTERTPDAVPLDHVDITGPPVRAHVQAFVDTACAALGSCEALTYEGHDPSADLAVDLVVSDTLGELPSDNNALGDALGAFALEHQNEHGILYVIWRQRINFGSDWEAMEDRGSITQNHYDHVHISFNESP